jgi:hypothetical protein
MPLENATGYYTRCALSWHRHDRQDTKELVTCKVNSSKAVAAKNGGNSSTIDFLTMTVFGIGFFPPYGM